MKALTIVPLLLLVSHGEELQLFVKPKPEVCLGCAEVFELLNEVIPDVGHVSKGEFKAHIDFACKTLSSKGDHKYKDVCKFVKKNQAYILRHLKKTMEPNYAWTMETDYRRSYTETWAYWRALDSTPLAYPQTSANT
uniref:Saposin B-type domain-containing protein n=1 Tax=Bursaphelenchus xylophilus TaxID=6326 RepID=A0A1I7RW36_BURXY